MQVSSRTSLRSVAVSATAPCSFPVVATKIMAAPDPLRMIRAPRQGNVPIGPLRLKQCTSKCGPACRSAMQLRACRTYPHLWPWSFPYEQQRLPADRGTPPCVHVAKFNRARARAGRQAKGLEDIQYSLVILVMFGEEEGTLFTFAWGHCPGGLRWSRARSSFQACWVCRSPVSGAGSSFRRRRGRG